MPFLGHSFPELRFSEGQDWGGGRFWGLWTETRGAPKTRDPTTTDSNAHSRPPEVSVTET